ncbi:MAG: ATP-dependent helicase [Candidatus Sericytochromatia bacterium]
MSAGLNARQQEAVLFGDGPLLVLAGAGAGKTRVLTQRVAHLVEHRQISPSRILVVTFTNKAAKEMKTRLEGLIGAARVQKLWIGTFHSVCARLLRQEIERLHYSRRFVIYDTDDQEKLMKQVMAQLELDPTQHKPRSVLRRISALKNQGLLPIDYRRQAHEFEELWLAKVYDAYQELLARHNALDFDDLLLLTLQLLRKHPELSARYRQHFQYILVDEYQDTNGVQFALVRELAEPRHNVCVVGDVDQSIYSFRNADFQIILRFQEDYPKATVIKLEENYRSTRPILAAANALIDHNRDRFDKVLVSVRGEGELLRCHAAFNEYQEADYVLAQIRQGVQSGRFDYGDICVLYRTNAQSRLFEERLVQAHIPHQILGAFRFYERKEIKDLIAYLGVIYNPLDALNLRRILNTPKRGAGAKTLQTLDRAAEREGISLWDALNAPDALAGLSKKVRASLSEFVSLMQQWRDFEGPLPDLIEAIYLKSGYRDELAKDEESFEDREAYIQSFIQAARDFVPSTPDTLLGDFLQHLALISDVDSLQESGKLVRLMTVHAAKGLEFPVVFVTGLEEHVFPHARAISAENNGDDGPIEEERRLMYVAMTRAQDVLTLTWSRQRTVRGEPGYQQPSRFLEEISTHLPEEATSPSGLDSPRRTFSPSWTDPVAPSGRSSAALWSIEEDPLEMSPGPQGLSELQVGERVHHDQFGTGTVEKVYASGERQIAIVNFPHGFGKRILDLRTAPLERV